MKVCLLQKIPKKYTIVDNYLIRGPHPNLYDLPCLKDAGVNVIYDFRHKGVRGFKFIERLACKEIGIEYIRKPYSNLNGEYPTISEFEQIANSVFKNGEKGGKTLFHCNSGKHRTAHMTAFYEITKGKESLNECKNRLGKDFGEYVGNIIQKQIINKNFYSRKIKSYLGNNPLKKIVTAINNRYANAIYNGQRSFITQLFNSRSRLR